MAQLINHFYNTLIPRIGCYLPSDDFYFRLGRFWRDPSTDRFGLLYKYSKYNHLNKNHQLPKNCNKKYEEICYERAKELIKKYPNGIDVLWSGGVDSTGIICIFTDLGYKNLHVIASYTSLQEYPGFISFIVNNNIDLTLIPKDEYLPNVYSNYAKHSIILNGFCNDQLFHRENGASNRNISLDKDWKDNLIFYYKNGGISSFIDQDINIFEEYAQFLNWPLKTLRNFQHLTNFGLHWETAKDLFNLFSTNANNSKPLIGFYDTQDFQNWSYTYKEIILKQIWYSAKGKKEYYKKPLKDIIYRITKDSDYYKNKGKGDSIRDSKSLFEVSTGTNILLSVVHDTKSYKDYSKIIGINDSYSLKEYVDYHVNNLKGYLKNE